MQTALLVIDMQMDMTHRTEAGRPRANPKAEIHIAGLLSLFRERGLPVIHVHHEEVDPAAKFRRGKPAAEPMPCAAPLPDEPWLWKSGSSAFAGTGLDAVLRRAGIGRLVIVGAVAAFCVTSTTRQASDMGFDVILPGDALIGFDIPAHDGGRIDPETVLRVTLSLLGLDFARLVAADQVAGLLAA